MDDEVRSLPCALKHGLSAEDIDYAWRNAFAIRARTIETPCIYAAAGPDTRGRVVELLVAEQDNGDLLAFHAMELTVKMARELGLN